MTNRSEALSKNNRIFTKNGTRLRTWSSALASSLKAARASTANVYRLCASFPLLPRVYISNNVQCARRKEVCAREIFVSFNLLPREFH